MFKQLRLAAVMGCMMVLGACAVGRSVVDINGPASSINPSEGTAVRIVAVNDLREFQVKPRSADIPSLSDAKIDDRAITERAYARKRGGFGKALGDVLLPEGETVANQVKEAITTGFRRAGYRVLDGSSNATDAAQAIPVTADILEFWTWMQPGFWQLTLHNRIKVTLKGDLPALGNGMTVEHHYQDGMQMVLDNDWPQTAGQSLTEFADELRLRLQQAGK
ncbi:flagellar biosynthesis protein [Thalassospira marina]|nr:flagellar biosynthesis protein [Thalassospira marina]